ncbi:peroxiredoxin [Singulisphaera rosea]
MDHDHQTLPADLPNPIDDGAASHLEGARLPNLALPSTSGGTLNLGDLDDAVIFAYPRTGMPDRAPGDDWNAIPGARGCTAQGCAFRDLRREFEAVGVRVIGLSTQSTEYQREFAERTHFPFPILSDADLTLARTLRLPTFDFDVASIGGGGPNTLLKRMTWFVEQGTIRKLWYPVFPPDKNADDVLDWLRSRDQS